jgi:hypothetical protein
LKYSLTFPVFLACILAVSSLPALAQSPLELGIDRSNLTKASESTQQKTLEGIRSLHAKWFRDVLSAAGTPEALDKFVNEVSLVKQNNLKMLVNVLPSYLDYDEPFANAGDDFKKICGWSGGNGKLSQINLTKFAQHLRAVKAANLSIDAFEIGNEFDTTCLTPTYPSGTRHLRKRSRPGCVVTANSSKRLRWLFGIPITFRTPKLLHSVWLTPVISGTDRGATCLTQLH